MCPHKLHIFGLQMQPNRILRNNLQKIKKSVKNSFKYILGKKTAMKSVQLLNDKSIPVSLRNDSAITEKNSDLRVICSSCSGA